MFSGCGSRSAKRPRRSMHATCISNAPGSSPLALSMIPLSVAAAFVEMRPRNLEKMHREHAQPERRVKRRDDACAERLRERAADVDFHPPGVPAHVRGVFADADEHLADEPDTPPRGDANPHV